MPGCWVLSMLPYPNSLGEPNRHTLRRRGLDPRDRDLRRSGAIRCGMCGTLPLDLVAELDGGAEADTHRSVFQERVSIQSEAGCKATERAHRGIGVAVLDVRNGGLIQARTGCEFLLRKLQRRADSVEAARESDKDRFPSCTG